MSKLLQQLNGFIRIKSIKLRWMFFVISIAIMVFIFALSAQPAKASTNTSRSFLITLFSIFNRDFSELDFSTQKNIILPFVHFTRKAAHFIIYAALGFFVKLFVLTFKNKLSIKIIISMCICFLYAVSDEIHQLFVLGRSGQISDVVLDFCGSCCGMALAIVIVLLIYKIKSKFGGKANV